MNFTGATTYIAPRDLQMAVNAAISLQKPLLIKGKPVPEKHNWLTKLPDRSAKSLSARPLNLLPRPSQGLYE